MEAYRCIISRMKLPEILGPILDKAKPLFSRKVIIRGGLGLALVGAAGIGCNEVVRRMGESQTPIPQGVGDLASDLGQSMPETSVTPWQPAELAPTPSSEAYPAFSGQGGSLPDAGMPPIAWGAPGCEDVNHHGEWGPGTPAPYTNKPSEGTFVVCLGDGNWWVKYSQPDGSVKTVILHVDPKSSP